MAITTAGDLITHVRQQLNSEKIGGVDTYALWKDDELLNYIDQAQQEFSRLTGCLYDDSTYTASLLAGTYYYVYNPLIIDVLGGYLSTNKKRVQAISFEKFEKSWILNNDDTKTQGDWEDDVDIPTYLITDLRDGYFRTYPIPSDSETLKLYVIKEADTLASSASNLEIPQQYRLGLTFKVKALAYAKHDVLETEDMQRSTLEAQKWQSFWQDAKASLDKRFNRDS